MTTRLQVLVDITIPMYLVSAAHPNKDTMRRLLVRWVERLGG